MKWIKVARLADLPTPGGRAVEVVPGKEVALFRVPDGSVYATLNACPHRSGKLADGLVSDCYVFCPMHDWKIDVRNGQAQAPDEGSVHTFALEVRGEDVYLDLEVLLTAAS